MQTTTMFDRVWSPSEKRRAFRALLAGTACVRLATAYDPLAALAAQEIGYPAGILAGSIASLSVLGAPDIALITLGELVEQARRICRAANLPLLVDGDHGYGNALNVRRMVAELEAAGVAAVSIEDTWLPAAYGAAQGARLISVAEITGKLRAALDARVDASFVILGRTHAGLVQDRTELLERQAALQDAGVDGLFVTGLREVADLDALAENASVPLVLGSMVPGLDVSQLAGRKVRICLQGHEAFYQALKAMYANLSQLHLGADTSGDDAQGLAKRL
ncbi:MAG: isocitrate lyase/phosphoenolpyruvate mutase family protein, partial [Burkholderiaceae bacterium]